MLFVILWELFILCTDEHLEIHLFDLVFQILRAVLKHSIIIKIIAIILINNNDILILSRDVERKFFDIIVSISRNGLCKNLKV